MQKKASLARKAGLLGLGVLLLMMMGLQQGKTVFAKDQGEITINPTPQELTKKGEGFPLNPKVGLVVGENTDEAAVREVEQALKRADVKKIVRTAAEDTDPNTPVTIWLGGPSENSSTAKVLEDLDAQGPAELKDEGYVLASGKDENGQKHIVLAGKDATGTFYAGQTFDQLIQKREGRDWIPAVEIRDWPEMPTRGAIEGFYGEPWSHEDRMDQLEFYGENKMNEYIYAPKDDPYHREKWREPYPKDKLAELQELVNKSKDEHVNFTFAISPGNSICFSDDEDFAKLKQKAQDVYDLGVRSFAIFLDDINPDLDCAKDKEKFADEQDPSAAAQAYLLNRFNEEFIQTHEGAQPLITVPTEYSQPGTSPYREVFADKVDDDVVVQWTGIGVVAPTITTEDAEKISGIFKHDLLIWDNYPVNDFDRNRLFLHPLVGRDANLTEHGVVGLTANPMNEAEASKIPLYTVADYMWNSTAYDPMESFENSIQAFGGDAAKALETFAKQSFGSQLHDQESPELAPLIDAFWEDYEAGHLKDETVQNLLDRLDEIQKAPEKLRNNLENEQFLKEAAPYLDKMEIYGEAGKTAVHMLAAKQEGDLGTAREEQAKLDKLMKTANDIPEKISEGVLDDFLERARWGKNLALNQPVKVNNYWNNLEGFNGAKAVDGDLTTRWASGGGVTSAWLVVELPDKTTINQTVLREHKQFGDRIQKYEIQYWDGSKWVTVHSGDVPSAKQIDKFPEVSTTKVRLNITSATFEPTVSEFGVYHTNEF